MRVTEVALTPYSAPASPIVGFADVKLDDELTIRGIAIVKEIDQKSNRERLRIRMPSKPMKDGRKKDVLYVDNKELFMNILKEVLDTYDAEVKASESASNTPQQVES